MRESKFLGPDQPGKYFDTLVASAKQESEAIRQEIIAELGDGSRRSPRTWGAKDAAIMVGRSEPWLRDNDPDVPRNEAGHGRWTLKRINDIRARIGTLYERPTGSDPIIMSASKLKGGVGNTTFVVHFAHFLANRGLRVLLWDLDPQSSGTAIAAAISPDAHLADEEIPVDALLDDMSLFPETIRGTYYHNVHLVPANSALQDLDLRLSSQFYSGTEFSVPAHARVSAALDMVKDQYDVILIDCPPALGMLTLNALIASTALLNPMRPNLLDLASYEMFCGSLAQFYYELATKPLIYHRILLTAHKGTAGNRAQEQRAKRIYGDAVLDLPILESEEISNAAANLSTVYALEKPIGSRHTYKRAIGMLDEAFDELLADFKTIWEMEANDE